MRLIKVIDIEGVKRSHASMYTYEEMINTLSYDVSQLESDKEVEERDHPIGWVIKRKGNNGKLIYIPVFEWEKFEIIAEERK